jgi:uncharacterized protein (DUF3084 family)
MEALLISTVFDAIPNVLATILAISTLALIFFSRYKTDEFKRIKEQLEYLTKENRALREEVHNLYNQNKMLMDEIIQLKLEVHNTAVRK